MSSAQKQKRPTSRPSISVKQDCSVARDRRTQLTVWISPRTIVVLLSSIVGVLILMHMITQAIAYTSGHDSLFGLTHEFNLNNENNLPTWYSSSALLLSSLLLGLIGLRSWQGGERYASQWLSLSVVFLWLSIDEAASLHEMVGTRIAELLLSEGQFYLGASFHSGYAWVIPGMLFVFAIGLAFLRFLLHLAAPTRPLFVLAGCIYVGGALGVEMLEARQYYLVPSITAYHSLFLITIEEGMEMLGIVVFIYALCLHLANHVGPVTIGFKPSGKNQPSQISGA